MHALSSKIGHIYSFQIRYWNIDSPERKRSVLVNVEKKETSRTRREMQPRKMHATIDNLPAYSNLQLDVVVSNEHYDSNASNVINVTTPEGGKKDFLFINVAQNCPSLNVKQYYTLQKKSLVRQNHLVCLPE